ncbi:PhzF family phenazine biosynthesis protein [Meiothermus taiwanensis]|jgi:PhzF family phenazine biosynthesis protein|uniref:Phenazine biosynthesis protein PhzF family n=2 Tax=Meiothermus taiwanensis TaxID=172827 RepID=A0ABM6WI11_9DEIN|nr:PhzF family phenazine biosynthesis protein [Meiothermus taiwanensis]AWR86640.1 phenazine biosynthesis protein PhzF family [Meiothermus taiwanensis WR-220]KIQ55557.1 phenazine biosynthesis protein PhzF [Meiothermus taiwanensis]KZK16000.1 phenazine biosynthesis protein PhzF [Meiothermus taiwanensis]RIH78602.1 putative isomerase YddE [Meiothermus taiwanensis]
MSREGRRISYQLADAFTEVPGGGNRVALVLDARGLTTEEMQQVAAKLGQPQAAFVTHREGSAFEVRFFAANGEVEFSGHAAVALAVALSREVESSSDPRKLYFRTIGESLLVEVADRRATVQSPSPRFRDPPPWKTLQEIIEVMGANERYIHRGLPYGITFTGLWTLFMPLVAPGLVDALEPDMEQLAELSDALEVATIHAYAPYGPRRFYARTFAPALGIPEDPVTGSPNAALGALLARAGVVPRWEGEVSLSVTQGHRMGGPGQVEVRVSYGPAGNILGVFIGGTAVVAEHGVVELGGSPN